MQLVCDIRCRGVSFLGYNSQNLGREEQIIDTRFVKKYHLNCVQYLEIEVSNFQFVNCVNIKSIICEFSLQLVVASYKLGTL